MGVGVGVGVDQSTIARRVSCRGIGLHGGAQVEISLRPAEPGSGIVFVLLESASQSRSSAGSEAALPVEIPARAAAVLSSLRATSLTDGCGTTLSTVEHLLATLFVLRIENLRVEVSGSEIPMMDGSAAPFVEWVRSAGRVWQQAPRAEFEVVRPLEIREGESLIRIEPGDGLSVSYSIDFDHPCIGRQAVVFEKIDEECFEREIAGARTFGFEHEIESLRAAGLSLGGSFENAIVLDDEGVLNASGLRWRDEFVRHKVLDLLGDLSLLGASLNGHVHVERGGHGLHHRLVRTLLERVDVLAPVAGRIQAAEETAAPRLHRFA